MANKQFLAYIWQNVMQLSAWVENSIAYLLVKGVKKSQFWADFLYEYSLYPYFGQNFRHCWCNSSLFIAVGQITPPMKDNNALIQEALRSSGVEPTYSSSPSSPKTSSSGIKCTTTLLSQVHEILTIWVWLQKLRFSLRFPSEEIFMKYYIRLVFCPHFHAIFNIKHIVLNL